MDSLSTSAGTEDHVSMGGFAARKALQVVEHVEQGNGQFLCSKLIKKNQRHNVNIHQELSNIVLSYTTLILLVFQL